MLYIYLDTTQIKVMHVKKSLLGAYDTSFVNKSLQIKMIEDGLPTNPDVIASGIKEALSGLPEQSRTEKNVTLILPQEAFLFFRADMPIDVTEEVLDTYLREKARSHLNSDIDNSYHYYIIRESEGKKKILFFAIKKEVLEAYKKPLELIDLNLKQIVPEPLTYYKLFEKTLRSNKKENIWYVSYDQDSLSGYVFDSYGLLEEKRWTATLSTTKKIETTIQKQVAILEAQNIKLNRLILSGSQSDEIRQDTFTKDVGVWTNPIKRIIPHFYADYLKILKGQTDKELPILTYDMLIGAFIFTSEDKKFSMVTSEGDSSHKPNLKSSRSIIPKISISKKTVFLFLTSFILTIIVIAAAYFLRSGRSFSVKMPAISIPGLTKPTSTPIPPSPTLAPPTATPTPSINRSEVRVKVLNGIGVVGKAGEVKTYLQSVGYEDFQTDNADNYDYVTTVIQSKKGDDELKNLLELDIQSQVENKVKFELLPDDDAADIVLIVGADFK